MRILHTYIISGIKGNNCYKIISTLWLIFFLNNADVYSQKTSSVSDNARNTKNASSSPKDLFRTASPLCIPPPVTVSPSNALICNPGGSTVTLTAIGATTYSWSPSTGLSTTTGSIVNANPPTTTTYTVTGTDEFGCPGTTTVTVRVGNKPVLSPVASPATVCSGGNATLNTNAAMPALTYCTPTYATGTGQGDFISLVQILTTTLNNPTVGALSPYYTLFPASGITTANLVGNTSYTMSVKGGIFGICYIRGWIDYNQDGVFTDTETTGVSSNVGASTAGSIVFTIPISAINGTTRLRLRSSDIFPGPGTGDFCSATNSGFGETEDYVITITGATAQFTYVWSPATFLTGTTVNPTTASAVTVTTNYNCVVTTAAGCNTSGSVPVTVNTITVTNPITPAGTTGVPFSQSFTQSGAIGGATFSLNTGILPTGLTLSSAGLLSGTATQSGSFNITVKVIGGNGCMGTGITYALVISSSTITVNLKLFLQGYYVGGSTMQPVLNNQSVPSSLSTQTDTLIIELHHPTNFTLIDSKKAVLSTTGFVSATFTQLAGSYYIAIKHRNTIQTWSANSVACSNATPLYNFSSFSTQAFGDNQVQVEPGVWAMFTGDLNQDDFIDGNDFPSFDTDSFNGVNSIYVATDMNGDGFVDGNDFPLFDVNSFNGVSSIHP